MSAHSSLWARLVLSLRLGSLSQAGAPFSLTNLRDSEIQKYPHPQHHLGMLKWIFIILLLKQFQFKSGCAMSILRGFCHGKNLDHKLYNRKDKVSRGDIGSNGGLVSFPGTCLPSHLLPPMFGAPVWGLRSGAISQPVPPKLLCS